MHEECLAINANLPPRPCALPLYGTPVAPSAAESNAQKDRERELLEGMWTVRGVVCVHMLFAVPDHFTPGQLHPPGRHLNTQVSYRLVLSEFLAFTPNFALHVHFS